MFVGSIVYTSIRPKFSSMAFVFSGQIHVTLNPNLILFLDNDLSNVVFIHLANVTLCGFVELFLTMVASLSFLNVVLNGLKHETSKGCKTCEVWDGRVTMSKPN